MKWLKWKLPVLLPGMELQQEPEAAFSLRKPAELDWKGSQRVQCPACCQAQQELSNCSPGKCRTHQKCRNEQKLLGSLAGFKADLTLKQQQILAKTGRKTLPLPWGDTWVGRHLHPYGLGDSQDMHFSWFTNNLDFQTTSDPLLEIVASFRENPSLQVISKCLSTKPEKCLCAQHDSLHLNIPCML